MDDLDDSPCKNVYIDIHGKYRRYSGLLARTPKRFKPDSCRTGEHLTNKEELLNLGFVQEINTFDKEAIPNVNLIKLAHSFENNLTLITEKQKKSRKQTLFKSKVGTSRKSTYNEHNSPTKNSFKTDVSKDKLGRSLKAKQDGFFSDGAKTNTKSNKEKKIQKTSKNNRDKLSGEEEIPIIRSREREGKKRRLSGLFKTDLNAGFIEESPLNDEELSPNEELGIVDEVESSQGEECLFQNHNTKYSVTEKSDEEENINITPVKSKLRKRPNKKMTEEEVIKYYTNKTVKKKQNTLETIYETPKSGPMSVRRYKRYINFNERMSGVKVRKRYNKIVKYDLWENSHPVSMDYFVSKLEEVEKDL